MKNIERRKKIIFNILEFVLVIGIIVLLGMSVNKGIAGLLGEPGKLLIHTKLWKAGYTARCKAIERWTPEMVTRGDEKIKELMTEWRRLGWQSEALITVLSDYEYKRDDIDFLKPWYQTLYEGGGDCEDGAYLVWKMYGWKGTFYNFIWMEPDGESWYGHLLYQTQRFEIFSAANEENDLEYLGVWTDIEKLANTFVPRGGRLKYILTFLPDMTLDTVVEVK